jgi:hypothetical protein
MAAISNQQTNWKQAAMQKAERITDYWDIVKAYCGRSAEVVLSLCMFASLIGVLLGIHYWPWVNNLILAIQIIMLDMGGFALNTLAEHARDNGQEEAAQKAESMARFLIGLVIATLAIITIGQLSAIAGPYAGVVKTSVGYAEPLLILVRVISTVKYIHTIHSLRGSTSLDVQPTQVPTQSIQDERVDRMEDAMNTLASRLTTVLEAVQASGCVDQPTQVVEVPTHDLYTTIQPLRLRAGVIHGRINLLAMVASHPVQEPETREDAMAREADTSDVATSAQVSYPDVAGVSTEKVRQILDAFLSGTKWRAIPGNSSQTVKPVRDAWESLHTARQLPTQNVEVATRDLYNLHKAGKEPTHHDRLRQFGCKCETTV